MCKSTAQEGLANQVSPQDGKSNYLEGAMLIGMYIIIALAFVSFLPPPSVVASD